MSLYLMNVVGTDIYKIGYTTMHPKKRSYGVKYFVGEVKLIDYVFTDRKYESILHKYFKLQKVENGFREYFKLSFSDVNFVLDFFKKIKKEEPIMNPSHPEWKSFLKKVSAIGRIWKYDNYYASESILSKYKEINVDKTLNFFKENGWINDYDLFLHYKNIAA